MSSQRVQRRGLSRARLARPAAFCGTLRRLAVLTTLFSAAALALFVVRAQAMPAAVEELVRKGEAQALWSGFLVEGDAVAAADTFTQAGCRGYLAWSLGRGSDVDLSLYSEGGQLLSEDHGSAGYGYARLCAEPGFAVRIVAAAYAGQGELRILVLPSAPDSAQALFAGTALGVLAPGSAEGERDVGEQSFAMRPDGSLPWGDDAPLRALGYQPLGDARWVPLSLTGAELELALPEGRCTRIEVQAPFQRGVLATVQLSSGELLHGQAPGRDRVDITACVATPTRARVRVRPRIPRGLVGIRAYVHALPVAPPALHSQHATMARKLELQFVAQKRGLVPRHVEDIWLDPGAVATRPLPPLGESCNALMILPDEGLEVDVRWVDDAGKLLSLNEGRASWPALFHCGASTGGSVRVRGRGRAGRASIWLASPEGP